MLETSGLAIATEGHILATYKGLETDPGEFPLREGLAPSRTFPAAGIAIPADIAKQALRALPKRAPIGALQHAALWIEPDRATEYRAVLYVHDLETWQEFPFRAGDVGFPDWRRVWPKHKRALKTERIGLQGQFLALVDSLALQTVYRGQKRTEERPIAWQFHGPEHAVEFVASHNDATLRGVLMPRLVTESDYPEGAPV